MHCRLKQRNKGTSSSSGTRLHRNSGSVEAAQEPRALSKRKHEKTHDGCALIIFGLIVLLFIRNIRRYITSSTRQKLKIAWRGKREPCIRHYVQYLGAQQPVPAALAFCRLTPVHAAFRSILVTSLETGTRRIV
jgi:hypothetical protein